MWTRSPAEIFLIAKFPKLHRAAGFGIEADGKQGERHGRERQKPRLRTHYGSQKVTVAAMQMAEKKVWAQRS